MDVQGAEFLGEVPPPVVEHIRHGDLGALLAEQPCLLLPLASCGAGDEDNTPVELAHTEPLRLATHRIASLELSIVTPYLTQRQMTVPDCFELQAHTASDR